MILVKKVFEPVDLKNLKLKNRLVRSATWEGLVDPDGRLPGKIYAIYEELARGGVGGIITGFTSVALHDFYFGGMMRLCEQDLPKKMKADPQTVSRCVSCNRCYSSDAHQCVIRGTRR